MLVYRFLAVANISQQRGLILYLFFSVEHINNHALFLLNFVQKESNKSFFIVLTQVA